MEATIIGVLASLTCAAFGLADAQGVGSSGTRPGCGTGG